MKSLSFVYVESLSFKLSTQIDQVKLIYIPRGYVGTSSPAIRDQIQLYL